MTKNIALTLKGSFRVRGCFYYLLTLIDSLSISFPDSYHFFVFVADDDPQDYINDLKQRRDITLIFSDIYLSKSYVISQLISIVFGRDPRIVSLFRLHSIDLVLEAATFNGWSFPFAVVVWIPDFQHLYLPHLFAYHLWWRRELGFRLQSLFRRTFVFSSYDALSAFKRYRSTSHTPFVAQFAVMPPPKPSDEFIDSVLAFYSLPSHFILLPNQFWRHKNHLLVIDALAMLKHNGYSPPTVFACGPQIDLRDRSYFAVVQQKVLEASLHNSFIMPGVIPRDHLISLMYKASFLLNPSLFEGWSSTVEEAKSINLLMLLSDIPVHHEQASDQATFFDPRDPLSLYNVFISLLNPDMAPKDHQLVAINRTRRSLSKFATMYKGAFDTALRITRSS